MIEKSSLLSEESKNATRTTYEKQPMVRIGLTKGIEAIDFNSSDDVLITDGSGEVLMQKAFPKVKWRVKVVSAKPAEFIYRVLLGEFANEQEALGLIEELKGKGYGAELKIIGGKLKLAKKEINLNKRYKVLYGEFESIEAARLFCENFLGTHEPRVFPEKVKDATGTVEIFNLEYGKSTRAKDAIRIVPCSEDTTITIFDLKSTEASNTGEDKKEDRIYRGVVEFRIDNAGTLMAICEIPLELYVQGVISATISSTDFPLEAFKAQAIACRGYALCRIGLTHPDEPYDLCGGSHCQVFCGITEITPIAKEAVESTAGMVLVYKGEICDCRYSPICGGHTETTDNTYCSSRSNYLRPIYDAEERRLPGFPKDLKKEKDVKKWVESQPRVYCNLLEGSDLNSGWGLKKFFRWETEYSRQELEEIVKKNTGTDIGTLYEIIPLERGSSGRLKAIEILGSRKNITIKEEAEIQRVFSGDSFLSTCFVVEVEMAENGTPIHFVFKGAGAGHGVGMCQMGAAVMAGQGKSFREILKHYYNGALLKKIY